MRAAVGDALVVRSRHIRAYERRGEIVEVHGVEGAPPFVVRWEPDGHEGLFFPGPDVLVRHVPPALPDAPRVVAAGQPVPQPVPQR